MSFSKVQEFIDLAKQANVCELKYETGSEKYSVSFPTDNSTVLSPPQQVTSQQLPKSETVPTKATNNNYIEITSPFVGTFYRSPNPQAEMYVNVGDQISNGKVLCIVEAMKIMNEIESEISGKIVEICVENENFVEFGQVLFKVEP